MKTALFATLLGLSVIFAAQVAASGKAQVKTPRPGSRTIQIEIDDAITTLYATARG